MKELARGLKWLVLLGMAVALAACSGKIDAPLVVGDIVFNVPDNTLARIRDRDIAEEGLIFERADGGDPKNEIYARGSDFAKKAELLDFIERLGNAEGRTTSTAVPSIDGDNSLSAISTYSEIIGNGIVFVGYVTRLEEVSMAHYFDSSHDIYIQFKGLTEDLPVFTAMLESARPLEGENSGVAAESEPWN